MKQLATILGFIMFGSLAFSQVEKCDSTYLLGDWLEAMGCYANEIKADPDNSIYSEVMKERAFMLYTNVLQFEKCKFEHALINFRNESSSSIGAKKYADAILLMLRIDSVREQHIPSNLIALSDSLENLGIPIPDCFEFQMNWNQVGARLERMLSHLALDSADSFLNSYRSYPQASEYHLRIANYRNVLGQEQLKNYDLAIQMIEKNPNWFTEKGLAKLHERISKAKRGRELCISLLQQGDSLFRIGDIAKARSKYLASIELGECDENSKAGMNRCDEFLEALAKYHLLGDNQCFTDYACCKATFEKYRFSSSLANQLYTKIHESELTEAKRQQLLDDGKEALCKQAFSQAQKQFAEAATLCQYDKQATTYLKTTKELKGATENYYLGNYDTAIPVFEYHRTVCPFCEYYTAYCYLKSRKKIDLIKAQQAMISASSRGHEAARMELQGFKEKVRNTYGQTGVQFDFVASFYHPTTNLPTARLDQVSYHFDKLGNPNLNVYFPIGFQIRQYDGNARLNFAVGARYIHQNFSYKGHHYRIQTVRFPLSLLLHTPNRESAYSRPKPYQGIRLVCKLGPTVDLNISDSNSIRKFPMSTHFALGFELGGRHSFLSLLLEKHVTLSNLFSIDSPLFGDNVKTRGLGFVMIFRPW